MAANVNIVVNAQDRASGVIRGVASAFSSMLRVALGIQLSQVLNRMGQAVRKFAINSIDAAAGLQQFQIGIETLIAREQLMKNETMAIGDAFAFAASMSDEYIMRLQDIALLSPFQFADVQRVVRQAMAFGFGAEEAVKYAEATLNVAAGVGASNDMLRRMAYNLAQIRLQGKVTKLDIRQLALAGFDLGAVLQHVGKMFDVEIKSHLDFNKAIDSGKISWADFTTAYADYADTYFGGASERMARTFFGLKNTMMDVFGVTMPQILGPTLDVITGYTSELLDMLIALRESGDLEAWGQQIKTAFDTNIKPVFDYLLYGTADDDSNLLVNILITFKYLKQEGFFGPIWTTWLKSFSGIDLKPLQEALGYVSDIIDLLNDNESILSDPVLENFGLLLGLEEDTLTNLKADIQKFYDDVALIINTGVLTEEGGSLIADMLGVDPQVITDIQTSIDTVISWFEEKWEQFLTVTAPIWETFKTLVLPLLGVLSLALLDLAGDVMPVVLEMFDDWAQWAADNAESINAMVEMFTVLAGVIGLLLYVALKTTWAILSPVLLGLQDFFQLMIEFGMLLAQGKIGEAFTTLFTEVNTVLFNIAQGIVTNIIDMLIGWSEAIWPGIEPIFDDIMLNATIKALEWALVLEEWVKVLTDSWALHEDTFKLMGTDLWTDIQTGFQEALDLFIIDIPLLWTDQIRPAIDDWLVDAVQFGVDLIASIAIGFANGLSLALISIGKTIGSIIAFVAKQLQADSPSKVFMELGAQSMEGYTLGFNPNQFMSMGLKAAQTTAMAGAGSRGGGTTIINNYHGVTLQNRLQAERDLRPIVKKING